jgi:hypothetical protein
VPVLLGLKRWGDAWCLAKRLVGESRII